MYLFRSRDRRLMEQTERDLALTLQRDYRTYNLKKTTELSNRVPMYTGYYQTGASAPLDVLWTAGTEVDAAFTVLEQLLKQLSKGSYQTGTPPSSKNPGIWPVASINWVWIMSLYASVNPAYATWLATNNITVPAWSGAP